MNPLALQPDLQLAANGDRAAFERVVDACRDLVCTISLAIVRDLSASEDVAQEVFLAAWSGLRSLKNPDSFLPWIRQVARNRAKDWVRRRARQKIASGDPEALLQEVVAPDPSAPEALIREEEARALAAAIDALPDEAREVVLLFYREGQSTSQVAALLEIREEAVKKRLSRAREALREATAEKLGVVLVRTAPGGAFSASVLAALPPGAPGAAAGAAKILGATKLAKILAFAGSGATLGAASAIVGIVWGHRREAARALDEEERRGLRAVMVVQIVATVLAATGMGLAFRSSSPALAESLSFGFLVVVLTLVNLVWVPKLGERRRAAERLADPNAWRQQRKEWWIKVASLCGGVAMGTTGLIIGLYFVTRGPR